MKVEVVRFHDLQSLGRPRKKLDEMGDLDWNENQRWRQANTFLEMDDFDIGFEDRLRSKTAAAAGKVIESSRRLNVHLLPWIPASMGKLLLNPVLRILLKADRSFQLALKDAHSDHSILDPARMR